MLELVCVFGFRFDIVYNICLGISIYFSLSMVVCVCYVDSEYLVDHKSKSTRLQTPKAEQKRIEFSWVEQTRIITV